MYMGLVSALHPQAPADEKQCRNGGIGNENL